MVEIRIGTLQKGKNPRQRQCSTHRRQALRHAGIAVNPPWRRRLHLLLAVDRAPSSLWCLWFSPPCSVVGTRLRFRFRVGWLGVRRRHQQSPGSTTDTRSSKGWRVSIWPFDARDWRWGMWPAPDDIAMQRRVLKKTTTGDKEKWMSLFSLFFSNTIFHVTLVTNFYLIMFFLIHKFVIYILWKHLFGCANK